MEIQPYVASKQISLPANGRHTKMCVEHMRKITANNTHRHDDICDTCYDAVKIALIDKTILSRDINKTDYKSIAHNLMQSYQQRDKVRKAAYGRG